MLPGAVLRRDPVAVSGGRVVMEGEIYQQAVVMAECLVCLVLATLTSATMNYM